MSVSRSVHGGIRLVVKDSGIGIPLEIHEKIFGRFFQNPDNDAAYNQERYWTFSAGNMPGCMADGYLWQPDMAALLSLSCLKKSIRLLMW